MKDDIDDWLDGLAGRRAADDPMDRALARLLRDASQSPVDELGRQRLFRRLEQEGLLTTATAPTRRRGVPSWMGVAASLMLGVSLSWWMWPDRPRMESAPPPAQPLRSDPRADQMAAEVAARANRQDEQRAEAARPSAPQADTAPAARALTAPSADPADEQTRGQHPPEAVSGPPPPQAARPPAQQASKPLARPQAFAPPPLRIRLPANTGLSLETVELRLLDVDGLTVHRTAHAPVLRIRWSTPEARQQMIERLPTTIDWPRLPDQGVLALVAETQEVAP